MLQGGACTTLSETQTCLTAVFNGSTNSTGANHFFVTATVDGGTTSAPAALVDSATNRAILSTTDNLNMTLAKGASQTITVTNNGPGTAYNVWPAAAYNLINITGASTGNCVEVAVGGSCMITFTNLNVSSTTVGPDYFLITQYPYTSDEPSYSSSLVGTLTMDG